VTSASVRRRLLRRLVHDGRRRAPLPPELALAFDELRRTIRPAACSSCTTSPNKPLRGDGVPQYSAASTRPRSRSALAAIQRRPHQPDDVPVDREFPTTLRARDARQRTERAKAARPRSSGTAFACAPSSSGAAVEGRLLLVAAAECRAAGARLPALPAAVEQLPTAQPLLLLPHSDDGGAHVTPRRSPGRKRARARRRATSGRRAASRSEAAPTSPSSRLVRGHEGEFAANSTANEFGRRPQGHRLTTDGGETTVPRRSPTPHGRAAGPSQHRRWPRSAPLPRETLAGTRSKSGDRRYSSADDAAEDRARRCGVDGRAGVRRPARQCAPSRRALRSMRLVAAHGASPAVAMDVGAAGRISRSDASAALDGVVVFAEE